jgi:hypothetical protein
MGLLDPVWTWWRGVPQVSQRPAAVVPIERSRPRVPAEYAPLYTYLEDRYATTVVLTFEQMEALLGFTLPAPALTEPDWWSDAAAQSQRHSAAWVGARRTAAPNLSARIVTFERLPDLR